MIKISVNKKTNSLIVTYQAKGLKEVHTLIDVDVDHCELEIDDNTMDLFFLQYENIERMIQLKKDVNKAIPKWLTQS